MRLTCTPRFAPLGPLVPKAYPTLLSRHHTGVGGTGWGPKEPLHFQWPFLPTEPHSPGWQVQPIPSLSYCLPACLCLYPYVGRRVGEATYLPCRHCRSLRRRFTRHTWLFLLFLPQPTFLSLVQTALRQPAPVMSVTLDPARTVPPLRLPSSSFRH